MEYRVIKENDLFLLTDTQGDIPKQSTYGLGLYTKDTRFLSRMALRINGEEPILLSSSADENYMAKILLTNPHMENDGDIQLWRESVEIERKRFIHDGVLYESIMVRNYYPKPVAFNMSLHFDVDFADMFVVRGFQHGNLGQRTGRQVSQRSIMYTYKGADEIERSTVIEWDKESASVTEEGDVTFDVSLDHQEEEKVIFKVIPQIEDEKGVSKDAHEALTRLKDSYQSWGSEITKVTMDYAPLQRLIDRGIGDMRVLLTDLGFGLFPVAGLPWFGVPFGRDSLIAALQMLPYNPKIAKGTLMTMAHYQGTKVDAWRDEEPGKIMHEIRYGELANTNQVPFTPYYGTIDATPLFLVLLTEYVKWTGDHSIVNELSLNIEGALNWIDQYGDRDGDGFVEYHQESSKGIANQGWKDSADSIVHRNGEYANTPIALAEVQGYVYQGKMGIADLYEKQGYQEAAKRLREEANRLKEQFDQSFWMEDQNFYAIALDENKNQVGTITSNPGHVLFSGMLSEEKGRAVTDMLTSPKMFSGYGIRTMGTEEAGYNPMSYHDGSVWPHDNSMILMGMGKVHHQNQAKRVIQGLIEAAGHFEYDRLPELFCGYSKENGRPVKYPVACSPQAWAAGTPLVFIQTMLGLYPDSTKGEITLNPNLLDEMNELQVENMTVGQGKLSLSVRRLQDGYQVDIHQNTTGMEMNIPNQSSQLV